MLPSYRFLSPYPTKLFTRKTHLGWVLAPLVYHTMIRYSQSVALATERVHQKRFYTEQGEIPLLFLRPRGCVYFIFPHIITVVRQSSRGRTFSAVTKKWFYVHHPKIAHDLGIVVPRACAKIKKNRRHSFRARRDDAFCD